MKTYITKYQSILVFLAGILIGFLIYALIDIISDLEIDSSIELIGIFVNVVLGIGIMLVIQKKLSDDRGVKDYFITEVCEIRNDYSKFINKVFHNGYSTLELIEWYKVMSVRIEHLRYFLTEDLKISNLTNIQISRELHILITNSTEFNNSFGQDKYSPSLAMKNEITNKYKELKHSFVRSIIKINRA